MVVRIVPNFRNLLLVGVVIAIATIAFFSYPSLLSSRTTSPQRGPPLAQQDSANPYSKPIKRKNVVVASEFAYHFDVYMAMAWTLERVTHNSVPVYTAEQPFPYGFNDIIHNLGIHTGPLYHDYTQLHTDLAKDNTIDAIVFGTCEVDMRDVAQSEALLQIWDARDEAHKFEIICIVHHVGDTAWHRSLPGWTRRNAVRLITLSGHVKTNYRVYLDALGDDRSLRLNGYEWVPIDVFVPILDIPNLRELPSERALSRAVIQGSIFPERRDYENFFSELMESLAHDPKVWGYLPLGEGGASYEIDTSLPDPPFRLYLLGSGFIEIPEALTSVVTVQQRLDYAEYYAVMNSMDICIPAFAQNGYYDQQASSTIVMALESNLPILTTRRMRATYRHMDDDRVTVTRPAAMSELAAVRALRTGDTSDFFRRAALESDYIPDRLREDVGEMIRKGWRRTNAGFTEVKRSIWDENDKLVERLLRDL